MSLNLVMRHQTSRELFRYWNKLRGNKSAPSRHNFEPAHIGTILPSVFMLEMVSDIATIRLAGGDICSLYGEELRGKSFGSLWLNGVERKPSTIAAQCAEQQLPFVLMADGLSPAGMVTKLEILILPMESKGEKRDRIIGCLADLETNSPYNRQHIVGLSLTALRHIESDTIPIDFEGLRPRPNQRPHFIDNVEHKKVGHLFVISGGRDN